VTMASTFQAPPRLDWAPLSRARTVVSLNIRLPAMGFILVVTTLPCVPAYSETQSGPPLVRPSQSQAARNYAVGDQVPSSIKLDDDGFPDRSYGILIVDGAIVVVIDRTTRRVVEVLR
jgi:hypothetical protein